MTPYISNPYREVASLLYNTNEPSTKEVSSIEDAVSRMEVGAPVTLASFLPFVIDCKDPWELYQHVVKDRVEKLLRFLNNPEQEGPSSVLIGHKYLHFKGPLYTVEDTVLSLTRASETDAVLYHNVENPSKKCVRPICEWFELVEWSDGEFHYRFRLQR